MSQEVTDYILSLDKQDNSEILSKVLDIYFTCMKCSLSTFSVLIFQNNLLKYKCNSCLCITISNLKYPNLIKITNIQDILNVIILYLNKYNPKENFTFFNN